MTVESFVVFALDCPRGLAAASTQHDALSAQ
jgi:hypothetical protein